MPTPFSVLVADLTYQYDSASLISTASMAASMTATAIDLFHSTAVTGSTVPHNNLTLIQGGSAIERYHMSLSQYTALHEALTVTDSSSVDFTITGQDITAVVLPAGVSHNGLADLATGDDHTQYILSAGRTGGQTFTGGTGGGDDATITSTSHGTKGYIYLGAKFYVDETTGTVNVATNNATGLVFGSLGTANRGLDMSASGLSGSGDYPFYFAANLYWRADGYLYNGSTSATLATQKMTWAGRTTIASTAADAAAIATVEVLHDTAAGLTSGFDRYLLLLRRAQAAYPGNAVAAIASNGALLMGAGLDAGIYRGAADQIYLIAGDDLLAQDNDRLILGTGTDFEMYHNATNTLFKITTGEFQLGNGSTTYLAVESDADAWWVGAGSGWPYGSFYGNEIAWTQASAVQNTWYEIVDGDIAAGKTNNVTFGGNGQLTVAKAGNYLISWSVTASCSAAGGHIQIGIGISGTVQNDGLQHAEIGAANAEVPVAGCAIIALTATQYVSLFIRTTDAGMPTLDVDHANLTIVQIGA